MSTSESKLQQQQEEPKVEDLLGRSADIHCIKHWIDSNKEGVIAIDGAWGSGKSWLGENLYKDYLKKDNVVSIWIDTFKADWDDDPELTIFSELFSAPQFQEITNRENNVWLIKQSLGRLAAASGKYAVKALSRRLTGDADGLAELATEIVSDPLNQFIDEKLNAISEKKQSLEKIRDALGEIAKERRIIIFVDELDRCSPAYAVKFLERMKHLFNAPQVVIVLLWNAEQLADSLSKFYGKVSSQYFQKFVNMPHTLFPSSSNNFSAGAKPVGMENFIKNVGKKLGINEAESEYYSDYADLLYLTAREVERFMESIPYSISIRYAGANCLFLYLLALSKKDLDLIKKAAKGDESAKNYIKGTLKGLNLERLKNRNVAEYFKDIQDILNRPLNSQADLKLQSQALRKQIENTSGQTFEQFLFESLSAVFQSYARRST